MRKLTSWSSTDRGSGQNGHVVCRTIVLWTVQRSLFVDRKNGVDFPRTGIIKLYRFKNRVLFRVCGSGLEKGDTVCTRSARCFDEGRSLFHFNRIKRGGLLHLFRKPRQDEKVCSSVGNESAAVEGESLTDFLGITEQLGVAYDFPKSTRFTSEGVGPKKFGGMWARFHLPGIHFAQHTETIPRCNERVIPKSDRPQ